MSVSFTSTFPAIIGAAGGYLTLTFDENSFANFDTDFDATLISTNIQDLGNTEQAKFTVGAWTVDPNNKLVYSALVQYADVGDTQHSLRAYYGTVAGTVHHFRRQDPVMSLEAADVVVTSASDVITSNLEFVSVDVSFTGLTDVPTDPSVIDVTITDSAGNAVNNVTSQVAHTFTGFNILLRAPVSEDNYTVTVAYHHVSASFILRVARARYVVSEPGLLTESADGGTFVVTPTDLASNVGTLSASLVDENGTVISGVTAPSNDNGAWTVTYELPDNAEFGTYPIRVKFTGSGYTNTQTFRVVYQQIVLTEDATSPVVDGEKTTYTITLTTNKLGAAPSGSPTVSVLGDSNLANFNTPSRVTNPDHTYSYTFTYQPTGPGDQTIRFSLAGATAWESVIGYVAPDMIVISTDKKFNPRTFYATQHVKLERSEELIGEYEDGLAVLNLKTALGSGDKMYVELSLSPTEHLKNDTAEWAVYKELKQADFNSKAAFVNLDGPFTGLRFRSDYSGITDNDYSAHGYSWQYRGRIV